MSASNTAALYHSYKNAKAALQQAKLKLEQSRNEDIKAVMLEAHKAGFRVPKLTQPKGALFKRTVNNPDISFLIYIEKEVFFTRFERDEPHPLWYPRPSDRRWAEMWQKMGVTAQHIEFLNWSCAWETEIWKYWRGETEFADIHAFIDSLKAAPKSIYKLPETE